MRSCRNQFTSTPETVENTDRRHSVVPRADHVVGAISDHDGLSSNRARFFKSMAEEFGFVGTCSVKFGAEYPLEIYPHLEMLDDTHGKDCWFARRDEQAPTGSHENSEGMFDSSVYAIFIKSLIGKSLAIKLQSSDCQSAVVQHFLEAFEQWRTDTPNQLILGWNLPIEFFERELNGSCDSGLRVGQCAVEVEKYVTHETDFYSPASYSVADPGKVDRDAADPVVLAVNGHGLRVEETQTSGDRGDDKSR